MGYTTFGRRLRTWRDSRGLSQEDLGEELGVERLTVTRWENGHTFPPPKTMQRIAEVTGQPLAWFFEEDEATGDPRMVTRARRHLRKTLEADATLAEAEAATGSREPEADGHPRGAPAEAKAGAGGVDPAALAAIVNQAVSSAMEPVLAKLNQQGAELHRLRQEIREQNRAENRVNDAKYWPGPSQDAPSSDDAKAKGA